MFKEKTELTHVFVGFLLAIYLFKDFKITSGCINLELKRRGSHIHLQLFLFLLNLITQLDFCIVHPKDDLNSVILYCNHDPSIITELRKKVNPQSEEDWEKRDWTRLFKPNLQILTLVLLDVYLFDDFKVMNYYINLVTKPSANKVILKKYLTELHNFTQESFYLIQPKDDQLAMNLHCHSNPHFFTDLLRSILGSTDSNILAGF